MVSFICIVAVITMALKVFCTKYQFTKERIFVFSGVLNRTRDEVEIYRVKDYQVYAPLYLRIFGFANLRVDTSDHTTPIFQLMAIPKAYDVADLLRGQVEHMRKVKGVREFD